MKRGMVASALAIGLVAASALPVTASNYQGCPFLEDVVDGNVVVDTSNYGNPVCSINGVVNGNVKADGVHLTVSGTVNGNLTINDGNLLITGSVAGNVRQTGTGYVDIYYGGVVDGSTSESGPGRVGVREPALGQPGGIAHGKVTERGAGDALVRGTAYRGVSEQGPGHLYVQAGSSVEGALSEKGEGSCLLSPDASITGPLKGGCQE